MKNLFREAHKMTREMTKKYKDIDYKTQFGLCLAYLLENKEEGKVLKGSEKQIKWATEIVAKEIIKLEDVLKRVNTNEYQIVCGCMHHGNGKKTYEYETKKVFKTVDKFEMKRVAIKTLIELIKNEESAAFVIENRKELMFAIAQKHELGSFRRIMDAYYTIKYDQDEADW